VGGGIEGIWEGGSRTPIVPNNSGTPIVPRLDSRLRDTHQERRDLTKAFGKQFGDTHRSPTGFSTQGHPPRAQGFDEGIRQAQGSGTPTIPQNPRLPERGIWDTHHSAKPETPRGPCRDSSAPGQTPRRFLRRVFGRANLQRHRGHPPIRSAATSNANQPHETIPSHEPRRDLLHRASRNSPHFPASSPPRGHADLTRRHPLADTPRPHPRTPHRDIPR
jgi:hypothetical protein